MKLTKLTVQNYKCVEDSEEITIDQVTCFVGKNESGKSALLEALYKLNPVEKSVANFREEDYPRRKLTTQRERGIESENVVTTIWELEDEDLAVVRDEFGDDVLTKQTVTIERGYENENLWSVNVDEVKLVKGLVNAAALDDGQKAKFSERNTLKDLIAALEEEPAPGAEEGKPAPSDHAKSFLADIRKRFSDDDAELGVIQVLETRLPVFLYFTEYDKLPGRISLEDLALRKTENRLEFGHRIFLALLELASSDPDAINQIGKSETMIMELEAIANKLTDEIFEYWTQNRHLEVSFRFDPARPNDPKPFNTGHVFNTRIYNRRHRASVNFDQRSSGFIWFFSFLIWFSQVRKNYGDNIYVLLDEPGQSLHGRAQEDLLRYINERLRPRHQVIYSTHSPFMLDMIEIFSVRSVEDKVENENQPDEKILGTKVGKWILSRDRDTILPLEGICGYDVCRMMFIGHYVIVVEGPGEVAYINWFSRQLATANREPLDIRWAVCPAEGADKISSFVTLFSGRGLKIAVLVDYHEPQKGMVDRLEQSGLLEAGHLLKTSTYCGQTNADIEDFLGRPMFRHLVNGCLGLAEQQGFPETKPADAPERLIKEAEEFNATLPPGVPDFDHYKPAEFLLSIGADEVPQIPGLEDALSNFERLFHDVNELIS